MFSFNKSREEVEKSSPFSFLVLNSEPPDGFPPRLEPCNMIILNGFTSPAGLYSVGPSFNGLGTTLAVRSIFTGYLENRGSHPDSGFGKRGEASICGATLGLRGNSLG